MLGKYLRINLTKEVKNLSTENYKTSLKEICHRATKSMCHNYQACALLPGSHNYKAHVQ